MNPFCFNSHHGFSGSHFWNFIFNFDQLDGAVWAIVGANPTAYTSFLYEEDSIWLVIVRSMIYICLQGANTDTLSTSFAEFVISHRKKV